MTKRENNLEYVFVFKSHVHTSDIHAILDANQSRNEWDIIFNTYFASVIRITFHRFFLFGDSTSSSKT